MKKIFFNIITFLVAIYILVVMVNWKEPKFFDYSMIIIYSLCLILVIVNIGFYFKKGRTNMDKNSQTEANKRWQEKNKERSKYISARSRARSFIKNHALEEDLDEFMELILERKQILNEMKIDQDS